MAQFLSAEDIKNSKRGFCDLYKFVRVNGSYRFGWVDQTIAHPIEHNELVDEHELDTVQSAGTISIWDDGVQLVDDQSVTLRCFCTDLDMNRIAKELEMTYLGRA